MTVISMYNVIMYKSYYKSFILQYLYLLKHYLFRQSIEFFSNALEFLNNFQTSDGPLEILQKDNVDTEKLNNDIVSKNELVI